MSNKQKHEKMQLSLNRKYTGYYQKRVGNILVTVQKLESGNWEGSIESYSYTTNDILGNDVEIFEPLFEITYGQTRGEVYDILTEQIKSM